MGRIVSGSHDKTIRVWNIKTNSPWSVMTLTGHSGEVRCLHLEVKITHFIWINYVIGIKLTKNFKMANSKKLSFSTTTKSWAIVAKISQIGLWYIKLWETLYTDCTLWKKWEIITETKGSEFPSVMMHADLPARRILQIIIVFSSSSLERHIGISFRVKNSERK